MRLIYTSLFCLIGISTFSQNTLLSENFENSSLPAEWSQYTLSTDGGWLYGNNEELQSDWWMIQPNGNFIATNDDACDCDKSQDYLILPLLDLSNVDYAIMSFSSYYSGETFQGNTEVATVEYAFTNGEPLDELDWTVLQEINGNGNSDETVWGSETINLVSLVGNNNVLLAFRYNDDGGWMFGWAIDNVLVYEPTGLNAELTQLNVPLNLALGTDVDIEGVVSNIGAELIESFDVVWSLGGSVAYSATFENVSLGSGESYSFTHPDVFSADNVGFYNLDVSITNVNGTGDDDMTDNTLYSDMVVIEYGNINVDKFQREYIYFNPTPNQENIPLVFVCHGYTGSAEGIMNYSEFNQLAMQYGFAVCYPQGIEDSSGNTFFNVGYDFQNNETVDDVYFLETLIDEFASNDGIDTEKVFCTGMSNGGDLCYLLACEASESFLGVAPVSGMIMGDILDNCTPSQTVGILEIHGTNDNVTYYDGDYYNVDGWGAYPSIPATIDYFADIYDIDLESSGTFPNISTNDGSTVSFEKYGNADSCPKVWLYTVNGGGHDWPGAYGNMDINSSEEAWLFFQDLCQEPVQIEEPTNYLSNKIIKVVDALGREVNHTTNQIIFYIYDDGSVEKKFLAE
tara:strand:- start:4478 stop:6358 length:1881 start_codon:yes stop_codon:yes gene_type:complete